MVKEIWLIPNIASLLHYRGKAKCTQTPIISPLEMNLSREKLSPMNKEVDLAQWRQITEGLELSSKSGMGCPMEGCCCWLWRGSNKRQSKSLTRQTLESIPALSESKKKSFNSDFMTVYFWADNEEKVRDVMKNEEWVMETTCTDKVDWGKTTKLYLADHFSELNLKAYFNEKKMA